MSLVNSTIACFAVGVTMALVAAADCAPVPVPVRITLAIAWVLSRFSVVGVPVGVPAVVWSRGDGNVPALLMGVELFLSDAATGVVVV